MMYGTLPAYIIKKKCVKARRISSLDSNDFQDPVKLTGRSTPLS